MVQKRFFIVIREGVTRKWYRNKVGDIFFVEEFKNSPNKVYKIVDGPYKGSLIMHEDCEEVQEG